MARKRTCDICGAPMPPYRKRYCSNDCAKLGASGDDARKYTARAKEVRRREKRLNEKIRRAKELGISYGQLMAREYIDEQQRQG